MQSRRSFKLCQYQRTETKFPGSRPDSQECGRIPVHPRQSNGHAVGLNGHPVRLNGHEGGLNGHPAGLKGVRAAFLGIRVG